MRPITQHAVRRMPLLLVKRFMNHQSSKLTVLREYASLPVAPSGASRDRQKLFQFWSCKLSMLKKESQIIPGTDGNVLLPDRRIHKCPTEVQPLHKAVLK